MTAVDIKRPADEGGPVEAKTSYKLDKKPENVKSDSERGHETLTRIFLALPDLMKSMDVNFLTRFGTETLTADDMEALGRVRHEADGIERELIDLAVIRHLNEGKDKQTARRLASAEFAAIFACGVDFLTRQGVDHA